MHRAIGALVMDGIMTGHHIGSGAMSSLVEASGVGGCTGDGIIGCFPVPALERDGGVVYDILMMLGALMI